MSCTAKHLRSGSFTVVSLSDMIEGSYSSWDLYTTGQLVDGLQQNKKTGFHSTEMESCRLFIVPPCTFGLFLFFSFWSWGETDWNIKVNSSLWMCPWCNGYRRRKWTRRNDFKSWTRFIAFHIALIPLGKVWIQLFSLQLWVNSKTDCVLQPWLGN